MTDKTATVRIVVTMGEQTVDITRTVQPTIDYDGDEPRLDETTVAGAIGWAARSAVAALVPGSWADAAFTALRRGTGASS